LQVLCCDPVGAETGTFLFSRDFPVELWPANAAGHGISSLASPPKQELCGTSEDFFHTFMFKLGGLSNLGAISAIPQRTHRTWALSIFVVGGISVNHAESTKVPRSKTSSSLKLSQDGIVVSSHFREYSGVHTHDHRTLYVTGTCTAKPS